jgi:hypothetical protein
VTHEDVMANINQLPLDEKLLLLVALAQSVREEMSLGVPAPFHRAAAPRGGDSVPPFAQLQGILTTDTAPSAEHDWKDEYTEYLTKKYA